MLCYSIRIMNIDIPARLKRKKKELSRRLKKFRSVKQDLAASGQLSTDFVHNGAILCNKDVERKKIQGT